MRTWIFALFLIVPEVMANPYYYPQSRFLSTASNSLAGVNLPITDEVGNTLMNNPAALARYSGYRAEPLNMNFTLNDHSVANLGDTLGKSFSLGGLSSTMNSNANTPFGMGFSNASAFAWGGFGVGIVLQEYARAVSDGTNASYQTVSQLIPTVGYGFGLARNIIRVGYSLQYVNQTSGSATVVSDTSASFLHGLQKGSGLSHNVSVNLAFPFTYLPTFSFIVRNIGGLHFMSSSLLPRGTGVTGTPGDEAMTVDASFDFMVRISGVTKTRWFFQYRDLTRQSAIPNVTERLSTGLDLSLTQNFFIRGGHTGIAKFSGGIGFRSENSEIGLAYYNEPSPYASQWDTRYGLQYKVLLYQKAKKLDGDLQVGNKR